jgi:hypothetical protein
MRRVTCGSLLVLLGVVAVATLQAQTPLFRLAANYDGDAEKLAVAGAGGDPLAGGAGGVLIYSKTVFQPQGKTTLFVTFSGTGDTHDGSTLAMSCKIDGVLCGGLGSGGSIGACGAPDGWLCLNKMPQPVAITNCDDGGGGSGDCHDNNINQTWCGAASSGARTVELKLAVIPDAGAIGTGPFIAFIEGGKYYVDSTTFTSGDACTQNP